MRVFRRVYVGLQVIDLQKAKAVREKEDVMRRLSAAESERDAAARQASDLQAKLEEQEHEAAAALR